MRLFAALSLPEDVVDRLAMLQPGLPPGRPVAPGNMHLTLCFFGDVQGHRAEDLHAALSAIRAPAFPLWLDGVDVFGRDKLRQVYAVARPEPALVHLHEKVEAAARAAGVVVDRQRFVPHVTLSRLKPSRADDRIGRWLAETAGLLIGPIEVAEFHLYQSMLTPSGPVYHELASYPLTARS